MILIFNTNRKTKKNKLIAVYLLKNGIVQNNKNC
jgi:hypothetical protein